MASLVELTPCLVTSSRAPPLRVTVSISKEEGGKKKKKQTANFVKFQFEF